MEDLLLNSDLDFDDSDKKEWFENISLFSNMASEAQTIETFLLSQLARKEKNFPLKRCMELLANRMPLEAVNKILYDLILYSDDEKHDQLNAMKFMMSINITDLAVNMERLSMVMELVREKYYPKLKQPSADLSNKAVMA